MYVCMYVCMYGWMDGFMYVCRRVCSFFSRGVHFKFDQTSCQQSLKYISLYNTEGAPFSTEERNVILCT